MKRKMDFFFPFIVIIDWNGIAGIYFAFAWVSLILWAVHDSLNSV